MKLDVTGNKGSQRKMEGEGELSVRGIARGQTDLAYCDYYEVAYSDNSHSLMQTEPFSPFQMIAGGTLLRTELVKEIGGYHEIFMETCDLYIRYLRLCERSPFHVPQPLYYSCKRYSGTDLDMMKPTLGMAPSNTQRRRLSRNIHGDL